MNIIEHVDKVALNTLEGFLLSLGITPSEDSLEIADYGPHRVYTLQGLLDTPSDHQLDPYWAFENLIKYINHCNHSPRALYFDAYETQAYNNGGQIILYVSISHTA